MKKKLLLLILIICYQTSFGQQSPTNIVTGHLMRISPKLTEIKYNGPVSREKKSREINEKDRANKRIRFDVGNQKADTVDKAIQKSGGIRSILPSVPTLIFDGANATDNTTVFGSTFAPPDPNMCVGPNHIVQMVNSVHKIYNKTGTLLTGPLKFSSIASTSQDDGDPIVLYDQLADRWVLLQFNLPSGSESIIFCVSQTPDPTGAYYVYEFPTVGVFPDYPHVGIWNNSYVITTHEFNQAGTAYLGQGFYGVDRTKMVNGQPTSTLVRFQVATEGGYLPVSLEGFKTPESASEPIFAGFDADEFGGNDELWLRTMNLNFVTPASSTLSARVNLAAAAFDGRSPSSRSAVEQLGVGDGLDAIADRMMSRVIYRRFDNYESLVLNYAVNVSGVNPTSIGTFQAGMRWYELTRLTPASAWVINQQSTYNQGDAGNGATGNNRWMGSIGIDQRGNIAMAYSKSSSVINPSINYAERRKSDVLSTLGTEQTFFAGTGSQTGSGNRWGDYTSMATDPTDEETLWYNNEYYSTTSSFNWKTKIGSFKINDPLSSPTVHFKKGGTIARQVESTTPASGLPNLPYKDYLISVLVDVAPSQDVNITFAKSGTAAEGTDYDLIIPSPFTLNAVTLSKDFTLRVYDNGLGESDEFVEITYTLNVNSGNALAGNYNQKHRITIIGRTSCPSINVAITRPTTFCEGDSVILNANFDANYTYQWYRNNVILTGQTSAQLIVKLTGQYLAAITSFGCTLPTIPITVTANLGVLIPTTVSRTIAFGTTITAGNGLQASSNCAGVNSATYSGPTIGYDNGTKSGPDPTSTFAGIATNIGKVKVSVTWRKRSGGTINDCGTVGGSGNPYNSEVSFKIKAPNNTIINLLNSGTYPNGGTPAGLVTTVFEDGAATVGTIPASGTFAPAQSLGLLNGIDPNGIWTLVASDAAAADPLCVESFSITVYTSGSGAASTITWYNAATGGSVVGSGTEYIPADTAPGSYTYYAEAGCSMPGLICSTSLRTAATLTITGSCVTTAGTVTADASVCAGNNSGTLTLAGHTGTILRWESSIDNFINSTPIANTTSTHSYSNLTQTTKFRAVVQDGSCVIGNATPATITVTSVMANASNTGPYFTTQTIQLNATGGTTYSWIGPNSFTSTANSVSILGATLAMNGIYTVTVSQGICSATATTSVIVTENNPCMTLVEYDYVKAGNPFVFKFPIVNNMVIAEVPDETSILVNPICPSIPIESFRMKITGLPYLHEVVENIYYFALFNNTGADVLGRHFTPGSYALTITGYSQDNAAGNIVYGPVVTNFTIVSSSASISAPSFVVNSLCAGSTFNVNFTATGLFDLNNQFDVQLSDVNGTFDNPSVIGSSITAGVVACSIPINIAIGSNYRIRVVSTNQTLAGNVNGASLTSIPAVLNLTSPTADFNGTGTRQAAQTINASNKLYAPSNVIYKAGNSILLSAGFQVNANSVFKAQIGGCN